MRRIQRFLINGLVLTATSLLMSLINVWFNVYLSAKIGTEAMGLFQLVMSVYSFGVTLATSGINFAATRLAAEELGRGHPEGLKEVMKKCLGYSLTFGVLAGLLLFFGAEWIGTVWLERTDTILPIRIMGIGLPFVAMCSALSGYFTAVRRVVKNAGVQIAEQLLRIFLTMIGLSFFLPNGLQYACLALILAGILANFFSFISSFLLYLIDRKRYPAKGSSSRGMLRRLLKIAFPIAMSACLRSGLLTLKNLLVPLRLKRGGVSQTQAYTAFGMIHGIVLPVVLFPSALLASFANLMIPELTEYQTVQPDIPKNKQVSQLINRMFQIALCFSIGVAGIFLIFSEEVSILFCKNEGAAFYVKLLAPLIPVMYFDNVVDCMLKGLNEQFTSMKYNVLDSAVSVVLVFLLLPIFGVQGYLFVIYVGEVFNLALSFTRLIRITRLHFDPIQYLGKPILCIGLSTCGVRSMLFFFPLPPILCLLLGIISSFFCYFWLLYLTGSIRREELSWYGGIFQRKQKSLSRSAIDKSR